MVVRNRSRRFYFGLLVVFLPGTIIILFLYSEIPSQCCRNIHRSVAYNWTKTPPLEVAWTVLGAFKALVPFDDFDYLRSFFKTNNSNGWKVILRVGNYNFNHLQWKDGSAHLKQINCPVTSCHFTSNHSEFRTADALIISEFHERELKYFSPKPRHQVWVAQHLEPPYHNRLEPKLLNGLVNWTATYRSDSTIALAYSTWQVHDASPDVNSNHRRNYAEGRTKKVAMFVSNCNDQNGRLNYAKELNKTIPVHIFGKCGTMKCSKLSKDSCFSMLNRDYKFYLSFENCNCQGYITEKLHSNALSNDVVPVVMGARPLDYATAAPPGSYIHVDDFKSPRHLGEYLNVLDSNDSMYNEFFRYKRRYRLINRYPLNGAYWCQLCTLLHVNDHMNAARHWYDDYENWWNGVCSFKFIAKNKWATWNSSSN